MLDDPSLATWATMLDPFGLGAFIEATKYWTPVELNQRLIGLDSGLLINRAIWLSVTLLMIVGGHLFIDIRCPPVLKGGRKESRDNAIKPKALVIVEPDTSDAAEWKRFFVRLRLELLQVIKSAPFIILLLIAFFSLATLFFDKNGLFGTANWPLTRSMTSYIMGAFQLMTLVVITYYSAEMVWRERQIGMGEIIESTPVKNWSLYFPKLLALIKIVISLMLVGVLFTVPYQIFKSWTHFEWNVYAVLLSLGFIVPMVMNAVLAVFIQVLSPNKYAGMLIFIGFFIANIVLCQLGLEHRLFHFARSPAIIYSDINQYGFFLTSKLWYQLYWAGLSVVLIVAAYALWPRGSEYHLGYRLSQMRSNMGNAGLATVLAGVLVFVVTGSFIFYNTNVLNEYRSNDQLLDRQAEYEKQYKQYDALDVPNITDVFAEVELYPKQRSIKVKGYYLLSNNNDKPLKKVTNV
jgi:ABC-2 type transport system permease protein